MSNTTPRDIEAPDGAEALMKEYALAEAQLQQAKDAMKPLRAKLLAMFPADTIGEFVMKAGKWTLEVGFPEKVVWDSDELIAYFGADLPPFVKKNLSINETEFARLSEEQRAALNGARDLKAGTPKIDLAVSK